MKENLKQLCGGLGFSSCRNVPNLSGRVGTSSGQLIPFFLPLPSFLRGGRGNFLDLKREKEDISEDQILKTVMYCPKLKPIF